MKKSELQKLIVDLDKAIEELKEMYDLHGSSSNYDTAEENIKTLRNAKSILQNVLIASTNWTLFGPYGKLTLKVKEWKIEFDKVGQI